VTLFLLDCSRYQTERANPLDLVKAKAAGFSLVNIALDRGRQPDELGMWARGYADKARELGLGICTYRWLDNRMSGAESAYRAYARMRELGGPDGMAHQVDCEDNATEQIFREYVTEMQQLLGRHVTLYSGRWYWRPRGWLGADLTPYLWAAPGSGYTGDYPNDEAVEWTADYGGWTELSIMQYCGGCSVGGVNCSLSAIRNPAVWTALTGTGGGMAYRRVNRTITHPSPNIANAWAGFMQALLQLEPNTANSGTYTDKPGYHNSRDNLIAQGKTGDYSIQLAADKRGLGRYSAAGDWTFRSAQAGNYDRIMLYGRRIAAAYQRKDPRLRTWREVLIQADPDTYAEGFDFQKWTTRTPDASHLWHAHLSELREFAANWDSKDAMLSILQDEPLSSWQQFISGDVTPQPNGGDELSTEASDVIIHNIRPWLIDVVRTTERIEAGIQAIQAGGQSATLTDAQVTALADSIADKLIASNTNGLTDAEKAAIVDLAKQALREGTGPGPASVVG
jgi:hypothetical protein